MSLRIFNFNRVNVWTRGLQVELVAKFKSLTNRCQDVLGALTTFKYMTGGVCGGWHVKERERERERSHVVKVVTIVVL